MTALIAEIILGYLTLTGSLMAAGKLQEIKWVPQRPVTYPGQNIINLLLFGSAVVIAGAVALHPTTSWAPAAFAVIIALALLFGVLLIIPIGGADMPTVIDVCASTGGGTSRKYYLDRQAITGPDDRGGAMALLAAMEMRAFLRDLPAVAAKGIH